MGRIESEIIPARRAPVVLPRYIGEIPSISNEIEMCLSGVEAPDVIEASPLEIDPEVNRRDIVELIISMKPDVDKLNNALGIHSAELVKTVTDLGGCVYTGSSLLRDVSDLNPARYRTTSLSDTLAKNLMDITSQQIVIGIGNETGGEEFGFYLYNALRKLTPVLLGISTSSPIVFSCVEPSKIIDTGFQSRRVGQYINGVKNFPPSILETPYLSSLEDYYDHLQKISDEVNRRLQNGEIDAVHEELYKERKGGAYAPFDKLSPHQVYWMVRPRPDHANSDSIFSLEVRVMDAPITLARMQAMNSFVMGLVYSLAQTDGKDLTAILSTIDIDNQNHGVIPALERVSIHGLQAQIGRRGQKVSDYVQSLTPIAIEGLRHRGLSSSLMTSEIESILANGTDASHVRSLAKQDLSASKIEALLSDKFTLSIT